MLVNYRADLDALDALVPEKFRPVEIDDGEGIGGVCLMRVKDARPEPLPRALGLTSENATHRIAVEWEQGGERQRGVFVPRRHTSSSFAAAASGRFVPGDQKRAAFDVRERIDEYEVCVECDTEYVSVKGHESEAIHDGSVFEDRDEASEFFKGERLGYAASGGEVRGAEFCFSEADWEMVPLEVREVRSSFFEKIKDSKFDSAFVMHDIDQRIRAPIPSP